MTTLHPLFLRLRSLGLSFTQAVALEHLQTSPCSMSQLAAHMRITTAACTGLVDRLEAAGWVERGHEIGDRRQTVVRITGSGREVVGKVFT